MAGDAGVIELPLRVDLDDRPRQIHDPIHGKPAVTEWRVIARRRGRTRVAFTPRTGRTHQLRVHAAHATGLGAPIVGDRLYGRPDRRLMLHAEALAFTHPHTGARVQLQMRRAVLIDQRSAAASLRPMSSMAAVRSLAQMLWKAWLGDRSRERAQADGRGGGAQRGRGADAAQLQLARRCIDDAVRGGGGVVPAGDGAHEQQVVLVPLQAFQALHESLQAHQPGLQLSWPSAGRVRRSTAAP